LAKGTRRKNHPLPFALCLSPCTYKIFMKKLGFIRAIRILIFIIIAQ